MNFFLGAFWLLLAAGMLLLPVLAPETFRPLTILDTGISFGWVVLVFAGFNFLQFWLLRQQKIRRRLAEAAAASSRSTKTSTEVSEYNPELDFSEGGPNSAKDADPRPPG